MFSKTDMYASKVGVKMDGKPDVKSKCGASITIMVCAIILGFTLFRLITVLTRDEALVTSVTVKNFYLDAQVFKASTIGFNIAFGFLKIPDRGTLAQYGHFEMNALQELGDLNRTVPLSFFDCSDDQLAKFNERTSENFRSFQDNLNCPSNNNFLFSGNERSLISQMLEVKFVRCIDDCADDRDDWIAAN